MSKFFRAALASSLCSITSIVVTYFMSPGLYAFTLVIIFFTYLIIALLCLHALNNAASALKVLGALIAGLLIVEFPLKIFLHNFIITLPDLCCKISSIVFAYLIFRAKTKWPRITLSLLAVSFIIFVSLWGVGWWFKVTFNDISAGLLDPPVKTTISFQDNECNTVTLDRFKGSAVVLYFWTSGCALCDDEFPLIESLYNEIKNGSKVILYAVFCREASETCLSGQRIIALKKYTIPCLSTPKGSVEMEKIGIDKYPKAVICNVNGEIIFKGSISEVKKMIITYTKAQEKS